MFNFKKIIQDLVSKVMFGIGTAVGAGGLATSDEWSAATGGIVAIVGIIWNVFTRASDRKDTAVVAKAVDTKKTTAEVVASGVPLQPVGAKKNYS